MRKFIFLILCIFLALSSSFPQKYQKKISQDPKSGYDYAEIKADILQKQKEFRERYRKSNSETRQKEIIKEAQQFLFTALTEKIFPAWIGTPWSFNGATRIPGKGSIACGMLVVYTLQDVGFKIPSKMARQPSENIIKNIIGTKKVKRFSNAAPMEKVKDWIIRQGEGIFIVGLDIHTGFVIYKNNRITFFHSSYYNPPMCVVNQDISEESPLTDSRYRVFGKILDKKMTEKWIKGESFPVVYDYFAR